MDFSIAEIGEASKRVKNWIETKKGLPNYVNMKGEKVEMGSFLHLLVMALLQVDSKNGSRVPYEVYGIPHSADELIVQGNFLYKDYLDFADRIYGYMNQNRAAPPFGLSVMGKIGWPNQVYIYSRIMAWYYDHQSLPNFARVSSWTYPVPGRVTAPPTPTGVYEEQSWNDVDQTTGYTCGPVSSVIALSSLGIPTTETEMARREWTTEDGTGHDGIRAGCIAEAAEHGVSLSVTEQNFSAGGSNLRERFKKMGELIQDPRVALIVNGMCKGWPTYYKVYTGGHYCVPVKVDLNQEKVWVADPARSWTLVYSFAEFAQGMALHSLPSLIILRRS